MRYYVETTHPYGAHIYDEQETDLDLEAALSSFEDETGRNRDEVSEELEENDFVKFTNDETGKEIEIGKE